MIESYPTWFIVFISITIAILSLEILLILKCNFSISKFVIDFISKRIPIKECGVIEND